MEFGQTLAEYVKGVTLDKVPQRDIDVAKLAILDQIGVALAGRRRGPGRQSAGDGRSVHARTRRPCSARRARRSTWLAALVNGTLGHTLDFDDCSSFGHPSVVLVPAMLATGETQDRSGRELLEAYIAGYEVGEALSRIVPRRADQFHGLHSTAMFGPLTSATVSGKLLGLDARAAAPRVGHRGLAGGRDHRQFRHAHQAAARRHRVAGGRHGGGAGRERVRGEPRCARFAARLHLQRRRGGTHGRRRRRQGHGGPRTMAYRRYLAAEEISLRLHRPGRHRRRAAVSRRERARARGPHLGGDPRAAPSAVLPGAARRASSPASSATSIPVACAILDGEVVKKTFSDAAFKRPEVKRHLGKFKTLEDPASEERRAARRAGDRSEGKDDQRSRSRYRSATPSGRCRRRRSWRSTSAMPSEVVGDGRGQGNGAHAAGDRDARRASGRCWTSSRSAASARGAQRQTT